MKILILCLFISTLYSSDDKIAADIFSKIIDSVTSKVNASVYIHTKVDSLQKHPGNIKIIKNCEEADIVVLSTLKNIPKKCESKILFGTRYSHLKNEDVIGAFFWQKGRPNILFYQKRIDTYNIKLGPDFQKYIEK